MTTAVRLEWDGALAGPPRDHPDWNRLMTRIVDVTGQRFGRLVVTGFDCTRSNKAWWHCLCDCGNKVSKCGRSLRLGMVASCGCLRRENTSKMFATHGRSKTIEYRTWFTMQRRCYEPAFLGYPNYGGRGIRVCQRWLDSFDAFFEDMGPRPKGCEIDRINNDGDYEPGNCRWTTRKINSRNRRSTRKIEHEGLCLSIAEWSERTGIHRSTITDRLSKSWPLHLVFQPPK